MIDERGKHRQREREKENDLKRKRYALKTLEIREEIECTKSNEEVGWCEKRKREKEEIN